MTYKGHIRNGMVVLDANVALPEGAEVTIEVASPAQPKTLGDHLQGVIGKAKDVPPDASVQKAHYLYGRPKS